MSDYLQNLLTRSLNPSRVVQPRLASLFEPRFDSIAHAASAPFDLLTEEGGPRPLGTTEHARPEARPADDPPRVSRPPRPEAAPAPLQPPPFNFPRPPESSVPARHPSAPPTPEDARPAAPQTPPEASAARAGEEGREADARQEHERRASEATREAPASARPDVQAPPRVVEARTPHAQSPRVIEPRVSHAPSNAPARLPQLADAGERALSEAAPTIRVTIGRVDVRAVTSPPPQEKQRAPEQRRPALTLEDYLRRRGGGGR